MTAQTIDPTITAAALLAEFDGWREERADLSAEEENGRIPEWADSDDKGCDLASRMADTLRAILNPPPLPVATGHRECLSCDATLADIATFCWQCKAKAEQDGEEYEADLGAPFLRCPVCNCDGGIREVDRAERWHELGEDAELDADGEVNVPMSYDGDGDYESDGFVCVGTRHTVHHAVTIPAHWNIDA